MEFQIKNRIIKCKSVPVIGDNADYTAAFTFDDEWKDVTKTARFIMCGNFVDVVLNDDKCIIPLQLLKKGFLHIGVYSAEMTSTSVDVYVTASIKESTGTVADPTEDVYAQILKKLDALDDGVDATVIESAVKAYMAAHPVTVDLTGYAKEADVKKYVADAVKAIDLSAYVKTDALDASISKYVTAHHDDLKGDKGDSGQSGQDGKPGVAGKDGYSPTISTSKVGKITTVIVTDKDGEHSFTITDGSDGQDGQDGQRGEPGQRGESGQAGVAGADGHTPVRGTDYWTSDDIASIKEYVDTAILGGAW